MAKQERSFTYQKRDKETLKERANMKGGNFDSIFKPKFKVWKPKDGKNLVRILPPTWDEARHYGLDIFINYNIGADNQSYLSLSRMGKGADPLEEARREAQKDGDKALAKALNPNQRILYWIIDRNDEDEGPQLWPAPFTVDKSLSNLCIDEDTKAVIFIDSPTNGRDFRFYKEGSGMLTKYDPSKMKVLGPSVISDDEDVENDWLDFIADNPLPDALNFYSYDHIQAMFDGQIGNRDDETEDEDKTRKKRTREEPEDEKPAKSRRRPEPEDEDEPEEKPKARKRAKVDPEDEPELPLKRRARAEPEDEDEPDEKPARRRARAEPEDEPEEKPKRRARAEPEEDLEEDPPSTRRTRKGADEEEGGTLRERLARRRSREPEDD